MTSTSGVGSASGAVTPDSRALDALAARVRLALDVDVVSVARLDPSGDFVMAGHAGARSADFRSLRIRPGSGMAALVVAGGEPVRLGNYLLSEQISDDYHREVDAEGLRGLACVPVAGPAGTMLLVYAGNRTPGALDDRLLGRLEGIAATLEDELAGVDPPSAVAAVADERRRLAVRLHDTVAQVLFAIAADAETTLAAAGQADDALARIAGLARTGRVDLRRTFAELADRTDDPVPDVAGSDVGASGAVDEIRRAAEDSGATVHWVMRGPTDDLDPDTVTLAADVAREAVRNAVRHGGARDVLATLIVDEGRVVLSVQSPAPPGASIAPEPGSGVDLLTARAEHAGGTLHVRLLPDEEQSVAVVRLDLPR